MMDERLLKKREANRRYKAAHPQSYSPEQKAKRNECSRRYYRKHCEEIKAKARARSRILYREHTEDLRTYARKSQKRHRAIRKALILAHYGQRCSWPGCNITDPEILSVDHVNGGGCKHRKENVGSHLYEYVIKNNFPSDFRILCMNHQFKHKADLERAKAGVLRVS